MANVVLVHGAWTDGSSWSGVTARLQAAGHRVLAAQLPLESLADDVAVVRRVLDRTAGPTLLVGHGYGGAVISGAAAGAENVSGLVYVSAFAPDEGESVTDLLARFVPGLGGMAIRPDGAGYLWLHQDSFGEAFADDIDPVQAKALAAAQKPIAEKRALGARAGPPAWRKLPSWYLLAEHDRMLPPEAQRWMAQRIRATVVSVPSSHAAMLSRPDDVAKLVATALHATAQRAARAAN